MIKFEEWIKNTHPELYDEGWKDWAKSAALVGALASGTRLYNTVNSDNSAPPAVQQQMQAQNQNQLNKPIQNADGSYSVTVAKRGGSLGKFEEERLTQAKADMLMRQLYRGPGLSTLGKQDNGNTITYKFKLPSNQDLKAINQIRGEMNR